MSVTINKNGHFSEQRTRETRTTRSAKANQSTKDSPITRLGQQLTMANPSEVMFNTARRSLSFAPRIQKASRRHLEKSIDISVSSRNQTFISIGSLGAEKHA
jgi:hypothetical protein